MNMKINICIIRSILLILFLSVSIFLVSCYCGYNDGELGASREENLQKTALIAIKNKAPDVEIADLEFQEIDFKNIPGGGKVVYVKYIMTNTMNVQVFGKHRVTRCRTLIVYFEQNQRIDWKNGTVIEGTYAKKEHIKDIQLEHAIAEGDVRKTKQLISSGVDLSKKDKYSRTPLHLAVSSGNAELVKLLLQKDTDIEAVTDEGDTALIEAAAFGKKDIAEILIKKGADVNKQNINGNSPLILATMYKHDDIVSLLLKNGANPNIQNEKGLSALHWAVLKDSINIISILLKNNADVRVEDSSGDTPSELALHLNKKEISQMLEVAP